MKFERVLALGCAVVFTACGSGNEPSKGGPAVVITNNGGNNGGGNNGGNNGMECQCGADQTCVDGVCMDAGCNPGCEGGAQCIDGICEMPPMDCSGFENSSTTWTLPQDQFETDQFDRTGNAGGNCGGQSGTHAYSLLDLTGDSLPDLVVTDRCDEGGVGTMRWDVFENTGSGFAASSTNWTLPQDQFETDQFDRTGNAGGNCGGQSGTYAYAVLDLTGDNMPDLVVTDRCDEGGVGTMRWDVFENTGSGFAASSTTWSLPEDQFESDQFDRTGNAGGNCGGQSGTYAYTIMDVTGDARPDLVVTDRCDEGGVGTIRWDVFENTGSGFAASSTTWSLPQDQFESDQFDRTGNAGGNCGGNSGTYAYSILDLTGDRRPDLVVTDRCDEGGVGTQRWDVFENTGSGFAESSTTWMLPQDQFETDQFDRAGNAGGNCGGNSGTYAYQLLDLDADGMMDLVVTDRCDEGGVGTQRWEYFRNQGEGFAETASQWTLPDDQFETDQFDRGGNAGGNCGGNSGTFAYSVISLDGDRAVDLVITDRCDEGGAGTDRWNMHRASCN